MRTRLTMMIGSFALLAAVTAGISASTDQSGRLYRTGTPCRVGPYQTWSFGEEDRISVADAEAQVGAPIPLPAGFKVVGIWMTPGPDPARRSVLIEFEDDLLLEVSPRLAPPRVFGPPPLVPGLVIIDVNGSRAMGIDPQRADRVPVSCVHTAEIDWWAGDHRLRLFSLTRTLDSLLKVAETIH